MSRDAFEEVLGATARAGLLQLSDAVFEKDGQQIPYRKARLTRAGYAMDERTPVEFLMKDTVPPPARRKRQTKPTISAGRNQASRLETVAGPDSRLEAALRVWRLVEARRHGVPAFRIFSDRTLRALATSRPGTTQELLAVPGIGISTVEKYGMEISRVLRENGG
jgi:superfamily II DNA helicase RecQ